MFILDYLENEYCTYTILFLTPSYIRIYRINKMRYEDHLEHNYSEKKIKKKGKKLI